MHLDCFFNIISNDCCLLFEDIMGEDSPIHRDIDEFEKRECAADEGKRFGDYVLVQEKREFSQYLQADCGYNIIPITKEEQLAYACNCLNLVSVLKKVLL